MGRHRRHDGRRRRRPYICGKRFLDWELADPKGRMLDEVRAARDEVARRIDGLIAELDSTAPTTA